MTEPRRLPTSGEYGCPGCEGTTNGDPHVVLVSGQSATSRSATPTKRTKCTRTLHLARGGVSSVPGCFDLCTTHSLEALRAELNTLFEKQVAAEGSAPQKVGQSHANVV